MSTSVLPSNFGMFSSTSQSDTAFISILYSLGNKPLQLWEKVLTEKSNLRRISEDEDIFSGVLELCAEDKDEKSSANNFIDGKRKEKSERKKKPVTASSTGMEMESGDEFDKAKVEDDEEERGKRKRKREQSQGQREGVGEEEEEGDQRSNSNTSDKNENDAQYHGEKNAAYYLQNNYITCPSDGSKFLDIRLKHLVLQVKRLSLTEEFSFEIQILDQKHTIRRIRVSTYQKEARIKSFLCHVPLGMATNIVKRVEKRSEYVGDIIKPVVKRRKQVECEEGRVERLERVEREGREGRKEREEREIRVGRGGREEKEGRGRREEKEGRQENENQKAKEEKEDKESFDLDGFMLPATGSIGKNHQVKGENMKKGVEKENEKQREEQEDEKVDLKDPHDPILVPIPSPNSNNNNGNNNNNNDNNDQPNEDIYEEKPAWNIIQLNLDHICRLAYGTSFLTCLRISIHANCRIRRIFFTQNPLPASFEATEKDGKTMASSMGLPTTFSISSSISSSSPLLQSEEDLDLVEEEDEEEREKEAFSNIIDFDQTSLNSTQNQGQYITKTFGELQHLHLPFEFQLFARMTKQERKEYREKKKRKEKRNSSN